MTEKHAVTRFRHELHRRLPVVKTVERLTPRMVRVTLAGDDLAGFVSAGYDDHVKLFFPAPGEDAPVLPSLGPDGPYYPEGVVAPAMRDYTPRRFDPARNELVLDFALHEAGPATDWAAQAKPGQKLGVGGPRGSQVVADDFDWYLLVGDETALPAIGRRLEELRAGVRAIVVGVVAGPEEEQRFDSRARVEIHWVHRPPARATDPAPALDAVVALRLPPGDGYAFVAGESAMAKAIRVHLVEGRGLDRSWVKAAGYWRGGGVAIHDHHDD